jgi:selenocysteine-specific elongation factor
MHVVATAGHVDHGKSALVRALTGMEPDRCAEERRRGMTIDLGFVWGTSTTGDEIAFVDVPGHERFVATMLAGVGPVPAVLMVVAADEGWMPQSEEHLHAIDALGVRHGVLVVTKTDLADPRPAARDVSERLARTSLGEVPVVAVSSVTGAGIDRLRIVLGELGRSLPAPDPDAPVRLWVDRAFTIGGAGTVVTGTLPAGTVRVGDELDLLPSGRTVVVRALESLRRRRDQVPAVARAAVNLRGVDRDSVARGMALVTPGAWTSTAEVDVLLVPDDAVLPAEVHVHVGAASIPARLRPLGVGAARLRLASPLPLHLGDRLLLRDAARRRVVGVDVAEVRPPQLRRRGAAAAHASRLRLPRDADDVVARRGVTTDGELRAAGVETAPIRALRVDGRWVDAGLWERWRAAVLPLARERPGCAADGVPTEALRRELGLPDLALLTAVVRSCPDLSLDAGRVRVVGARPAEPPALGELVERLAADPLAAPDADELRRLALGPSELARAARGGRLLRLSEGVYVGPAAPAAAVDRLASLDAPFTVSAAREALGSTRRVVVPLLEHLDAARRTRRLPDGTRVLVAPST